MKVKVTWRNRNPFTPRWEDLGRIAEGELEDGTEVDRIIDYAKEATPKGFWLHKIEMPDETITYNYQGELITV